MNLKQIYSQRYAAYQCYAFPIIYEWEEDIANTFNIPVKPYPSYYKYVNRYDIKSPLIGPFKDTFRFVTNSKSFDEPMNSKHVYCCIIDFFERDNRQLEEFYKKHSKNIIVLLSSPFDYQYLKERKCPINIGLFPYSLSDKYAFENIKKEKKYDIVLTGRQDPLLYSFFKEYVKKHPDVTYVKRGEGLENDIQKTKAYYLNGKDIIGTIGTREEFIKLQAEGRITLYGLQGYDSATKDFFHITPHFLEIIACGCHVILHYPSDTKGIDAMFYDMDKFSPSVESYEEFESMMDKALNTEIDANFYSSYLRKHYTSVRAQELRTMLRSL